MGEKISFIDLFGTELELEDEHAREMLADESAARVEDVAVLEARMDTFTALPTGSTAGDAELMDIRVGDTGITYSSAGSAVRAGDKINADKANALKEVGLMDLLGGVEWEQGNLDGATETAANWCIRTGYINVENAYSIHFKSNDEYRLRVQTYTDIDEIAVQGFYNHYKKAWEVEGNIIIQDRIKYVRLVGSKVSSAAITASDSVNFSLKGQYNLLNNISKLLDKAGYLDKLLNREDITIPISLWYQGIPAANDDGLSYASDRIMTNYISIPTGIDTITITAPEGYKCAYYLYDDNEHQIANIFWATTYTFTPTEEQTKLIIGLSTTANEQITPSQGDISITCSFNKSRIQEINNIVELPTVDLDWQIGTLVPGTGTEEGNNKRIRSRYILVGKGTKLVISGTSYHLIYTYDLDKNYVSDINWTRNNIIVENDCYIRILIAKNQTDVITEDEIEAVAATETIYRTFPQYLMDKEYYEPIVDIPTYFENEIDTAITTARTNIFDAGIDGDSFVLISDVHWQSNAKNSPALIRKAVENLNLDKIICGGDLIGGGAKATNIDLMADCVNQFKDITRFYCLFGNHDSNTIGAPSTDDNFTKSESYALMQKQSDFVMNYGEPCYFYFDNPTTKTRYICLDTGLESSSLPSAQSDWITATLNSTPDNYHILVFAHIIYMPTNGYHVGITKDEVYRTSFMNTVCTMCDTFNTNNADKKVEAIFGGHMHFDADFTSDGGIPIVLIDCDARQTFTETSTGSGVANHATGTINEQCFDIVTVDYANETIKCVRVGRGSNRTITY